MSGLTFTQALLQAEAMARSTLDVALHERLSCAVALVKNGRVFQETDGTWQVDSSGTEGLTYSVNGQCSCEDYHYNKPPKGLCKHRLAMFVAQRVWTLMQQPAAPVAILSSNELKIVVPDEAQTDEHPEVVAKCDNFPPPLPEAPASVNVRVTIQGRECQITLRDSDEARLLARLQAVLAQFPVEAKPQPQAQLSAQQHNAAAMHKRVSDFCPVHNVAMRLNHGKDGSSWHSHYDETAGRWCKGK